MLELTVLGSAGSYPGVGRVCSGYLLRTDDATLLLDAGNGAAANLQRYVSLRDLDAIVVSHRHVDHCVDLIGCFYNLRFDPAFEGRSMPMYAPREVFELLTSLLSGDSPMRFEDVFHHTEVDDGDGVEVGDLALSFWRSIHPPPTVSTRIEIGGGTFVYSGDSAGGDELVAAARGADLFLCEATWTGGPDEHVPGIHLTAGEAARIARDAEVGRLILTHIAGGSDRDRVREEAAAVFDGPIDLAEDLEVHLL